MWFISDYCEAEKLCNMNNVLFFFLSFIQCDKNRILIILKMIVTYPNTLLHTIFHLKTKIIYYTVSCFVILNFLHTILYKDCEFFSTW